MTFKEVLAQVSDWLQQDTRISYRALKSQFALDDAFLEDLKYELTEVQQLAVDHGTTPRVAVHDRHMAERAALLPALPGVIGSIHEVIIMGMPMRLNFYVASRIDAACHKRLRL